MAVRSIKYYRDLFSEVKLAFTFGGHYVADEHASEDQALFVL